MPQPKKKRKSAARVARQTAYRALVLDAAERVFADKGFDGATIKDIADEAGIARGTVYALFPGKRDVFIAIHDHRGGLLFGQVLVALDGIQSPFEAIARAQRVACEFYAQHPFYLRMHLCSGTSWSSPRLDVDEEQRLHQRGIESLAALFARAAAARQLIDEEPETCARLCLAMLQVLLEEWERESFATAPAAVAARFERHMLRMFARA